MKNVIVFSLLVGFVGSLALAAPQMSFPIRTSADIEGSCRVKAKEIAAETYRTCVTDQKNTQIEQIKKDFQMKLQALKAHYEKELRKLGASKEKASLDESKTPNDETDQKTEDSGKRTNSAAMKSHNRRTGRIPTAPKRFAGVSARKMKKSASAAAAPEDEMTVQLKPAPITPPSDESVMDLPEPLPLETISDPAI